MLWIQNEPTGTVRAELVEAMRKASTSLYGLAPINQPVRKGEEPGCRDIDKHRQLLQIQLTDLLSHYPIPAPSVDKEPDEGKLRLAAPIVNSCKLTPTAGHIPALVF
ncbi:hypothetical protein CLU88_0073 [Acidovorax sp. 56]|nr:hypothetical protein CLU88_0073 [Acidovorax sp. 56]